MGVFADQEAGKGAWPQLIGILDNICNCPIIYWDLSFVFKCLFHPSLGPLGRIYSTLHLLRSISGWRRAPKVSHLGVSGRPVSGSPGFVAPAALGWGTARWRRRGSPVGACWIHVVYRHPWALLEIDDDTMISAVRRRKISRWYHQINIMEALNSMIRN